MYLQSGRLVSLFFGERLDCLHASLHYEFFRFLNKSAMGCVFCATGQMGECLDADSAGNLVPFRFVEILTSFYRVCKATHKRRDLRAGSEVS